MNTISVNTISRMLHTRLNMAYKKATQRFLPASTQSNKDQHKEAAIIITALRKSNIKICYVDEYNVSE